MKWSRSMKSRRRWESLSSLALSMSLVAGLATIAAPGLRADDAAKAPADTAKIDKGKAVFAAQHCSMCHAIAGKGNPKTPLDTVGSTHTADEIRKYIVAPKSVKPDSQMKAYPGLPAEDLDALVAYLSSLKKK